MQSWDNHSDVLVMSQDKLLVLSLQTFSEGSSGFSLGHLNDCTLSWDKCNVCLQPDMLDAGLFMLTQASYLQNADGCISANCLCVVLIKHYAINLVARVNDKTAHGVWTLHCSKFLYAKPNRRYKSPCQKLKTGKYKRSCISPQSHEVNNNTKQLISDIRL